ncbi:hypothetical protein HMI55_005548 [Coelomomyces lativittatus]|nr:hypothetical protein HMI55_005548 [Coelomomyces lativittatus]
MNVTYFNQISKLKKFVLVMHEQDKLLKPLYSAWMYNFNESLDLNFTSTQMYLNNKLPLRELYSSQRLRFYKLPGDHLQFNTTQFLDIVLPNMQWNSVPRDSPMLILQE